MQQDMAAANLAVAYQAQTPVLVAPHMTFLSERVDTHRRDTRTTYQRHVDIVHHCRHVDVSEHREHEEYHDNIAQTDAHSEGHSTAETMFYTVLYQAEERRPETEEQRQHNATEYAY